ncbi:helix-turn-helix transcriptional regulator [Bradyrhizobium sp. 6(2017)]|uniref:helix-turn-helix transcriptional regulator n=1 Tax=Bradyrhizobium sp. 6(2017) TaxID=1197460 RepID=UPI0013E1F2BD|nr:helix-turn-helix domain-containing protein [Bradyrhizobium sp. 6(2017)]QIG97188.1 helix-turn-helix domain-containing protein [Bradyrhizobium sp. 6(2017)]
MRIENYLNPKEAAAYLKSSTSTLAKRRLSGSGPRFTRIGRAIRYRKSDLDEFMASSLRQSTFDRDDNAPSSAPRSNKEAR